MAKKRYHEEEIDLKEIMNQNKKPITNGNNGAYTNGNNGYTDISKLIPKDLKIVAKNESQKKLIQSIRNNEITIVAGIAGTGKTYIAISQALALLRKENSPYKKIYLVKSVTELEGESIGYLKGTLIEKISPFMWSFFINIEKIIGEYALTNLLEKEIIRPFPLTYMRGVTLDNCIILCDELQNVSMLNSQTLMTRIGSNAKMILLGDINQIDIKEKNNSSLINLLDMFNDTKNVGVVVMDENDENVRNPIISKIIEKYKEFYKRKEDIEYARR